MHTHDHAEPASNQRPAGLRVLDLGDCGLASVADLGVVDSTNSYLARVLADSPLEDARERVAGVFAGDGSERSVTEAGPAAPIVLSLALTDDQTRGRGRLDRSWYSRAGQSFLGTWAAALPTDLLTGPASGWLPTAVGLSLMEGLREVLASCGAQALDQGSPDDGTARDGLEGDGLALKWPNDVFCAGRKLAGVLCESLLMEGGWSILIAGVGLNLFVPADDLPIAGSTSLQLHFGPLPAYRPLRDGLARAVSTRLPARLTDLAAGGDEARLSLRQQALANSWTLGRRVRVNPVAAAAVEGKALGIGLDASLEVLLDDGRRINVSTGDVGVLPELAEPGQAGDKRVKGQRG
ncbi:biotin--[acetyl-CoA-carboxylase] ligase [Bifidobacterium actinocoloniiforme]|uniref:biotin--[acetyl-CoA-carboxylase] ligase n=1 Tax=Bifidobacterium actinocoloniiforme TaxID=638619 RepID=UPI00130E3EF6|nr:hypothetical protein [Bifidobacterium actinocoloniiforme]